MSDPGFDTRQLHQFPECFVEHCSTYYMKFRVYVKGGGTICCKCRKRPRREGQRYCAECHAEKMREWRKTHPISDEARQRMNARTYLQVYIRRGKIQRQPCEICGSKEAYAHHNDFTKPLDVQWRCNRHKITAKTKELTSKI